MNARRTATCVIGFLAAAAAVTSTGAGEGHWTSSGPFGGEVRRIVIDPADSGTLYLATPQGVFRGNGLGRAWTEASGGLADRRVRDLAVDAAGALFVATPAGVFRSDDGGASWQPRNTGLPATQEVHRVAADPSTPGVIYAGLLGDAPVFKTRDGGESWSPASTGLGPVPPFVRGVDLLVVHPARPDNVWVSYFGRLHRSDDGGAHWRQATTEPVVSGSAILAFAPTDPDRIYAGGHFSAAFTSADGGATWSQIADRFDDIRSLLVEADRPGIVLGGTGDGRLLRMFAAGGRPPELVNGHAFRSAPVLALAPRPAGPPGGIVAGTSAGVFTSADHGRRWRESNQGLRALEIRRVVVDPADSEVVYAGSWGGGVFKSTDRGRTWQPASRRIDRPFIDDLALEPGEGTLYAAAQRLFRSRDGGATWKRVRVRSFARASSERHERIWIDEAHGVVYVGGGRTADVYRNPDQGRTWESLQQRPHFRSKQLNALTGDPDGVLYVGLTKGVLRSSDQGRSWDWRSRFVGPRAVVDLDVDPASPETLYAVLRSAGFRKTTDAGETWTVPRRDLKRNRLRALTVDPARPGTVYAATLASGVLVSRDGGATLSAVGDLAAGALDVTVDPADPSRLYAATDRGVYEIDIDTP